MPTIIHDAFGIAVYGTDGYTENNIPPMNSVIMPTPDDPDCGVFFIDEKGKTIPLSEAVSYLETAAPVETGSAGHTVEAFPLPEYSQS